MYNVYIIIHGCSANTSEGYKDVWQSSSEINSYYDRKSSAELYLVNNGYERDSDGVYFLVDAEEDNQAIAKIVPLSKRY